MVKALDDIMPSGASRRYWVKHLDIEDLVSDEQDYVCSSLAQCRLLVT